MDKANSTVAVYPSHTAAEAAIKKLQHAGFDMKKLSIVGRDYHTDVHVVGYYNIDDRMKAWGKTGAFWGGLWGLLFGSAFFWMPGVGPLLVAGPLVSWIVGALVCLATYLGLVTIPARYLFGVTSALIALLAAGMAAQAIAFLEQANILTALDETVWDTSWILSDSSYLGRALHTLIGYVDQPTAMQLIVYAATLTVMVVLMKLFASPTAHPPHVAAAE